METDYSLEKEPKGWNLSFSDLVITGTFYQWPSLTKLLNIPEFELDRVHKLNLPALALINAGVMLPIIHWAGKQDRRATQWRSRRKGVRPAQIVVRRSPHLRSGKWLSLFWEIRISLDEMILPPPFFTIHPSPDLNIPFSGMQNQPGPTHVCLLLIFWFGNCKYWAFKMFLTAENRNWNIKCEVNL